MKVDKKFWDKYIVLLLKNSKKQPKDEFKRIKSMRKRVSALAAEDFVMLDEYTSRLDDVSKNSFNEKVSSLIAESDFVLSNDRMPLIRNNKGFILKSLDNDFSKTVGSIDKEFYDIAGPVIVKYIEEHDMMKDFVLTESNVWLAKYNSQIISAGLNNGGNLEDVIAMVVNNRVSGESGQAIVDYINSNEEVMESFVFSDKTWWLASFDDRLMNQSLENNYTRTILLFRDNWYTSDKAGRTICDYIKNNDVRKNSFVVNDYNAWLLKHDEELFVVSLNNDFESTIDYVMGDADFRIFGSVIAEYLRKNGYQKDTFRTITPENKWMLEYYPEMLESSLESNFYDTITNIDVELRGFVAPVVISFIKNKPSFMENFRFNNSCGWLLDYFSEEDMPVFDAALKTGFEDLLFVINGSEKNQERFGRKIADFVKNNPSIKKYFNFNISNKWLIQYDSNGELLDASMANNLSETCFAYIRDNDPYADKVIEKMFTISDDVFAFNRDYVGSDAFHQMIGEERMIEIYKDRWASVVPDSIIGNREFLSHRFPKITDKQVSSIQSIVLDSKYSEELEKDFLSLIGGEYSTVDDYLRTFVGNQNLKYKDVNLAQRIALKLYCQKQLYSNGVENVPVLFSMNREVDFVTGAETNGAYDFEKKTITIYLGAGLFHQSVKELLRVCAHEKNHAVQRFNMEQGLFERDLDIFIYEKDSLLRGIDRDYYKRNYRKVAVEFDAQFRAETEVEYLSGKNLDDLYEAACKEMVQAMKEDKDVLLTTKENPYDYSITRDYGVGLETLFVRKLREQLKEDPTKAEEYRKKYPTIAIGYHLNGDEDVLGKPRSLEEILEILDNSQNERVKRLCFYIIKERYDESRFLESERNMMYDVSDIPKIAQYPFSDETTRKEAQDFAEKILKAKPLGMVDKFSKKVA